MKPDDIPIHLFCQTPEANYVACIVGDWYVARVWDLGRQMRLAPVFAFPEILRELPHNDPQMWEAFRFGAMCAAMNLISAYDAREPEVLWLDHPASLPEYLLGYDLLPARLASFPNRQSRPTVGLIHTCSPWWAVLMPQAARTLEQAQFLVPGDPDDAPDGIRDAAVRQAIRLLQDAP